MSTQSPLETYRAWLLKQELLLLEHSDAVLSFLEGPHKAKDTKVQIGDLRSVERNINQSLEQLLLLRQSQMFRLAAKDLCLDCRALYTYTRQMEALLVNDYDALSQKEAKERTDVARDVGIFFGIVAAFVSCRNMGIGKDLVTIDEAAKVGTTISAIAVGHRLAWRSARALFAPLGRGLAKTGQKLAKTKPIATLLARRKAAQARSKQKACDP